jgi:hypothetical protein
LRWGIDGWQKPQDLTTHDTDLGVHVVELDAAVLAGAHDIEFTFEWRDGGAWAGKDFRVTIDG